MAQGLALDERLAPVLSVYRVIRGDAVGQVDHREGESGGLHGLRRCSAQSVP